MYRKRAVGREDEFWKDAACVGENPAFFDTDTTATYDIPVGKRTKIGKRICATCDIRPDCLDYALENNMTGGIWGGLDGVERNALGKSRGRGSVLRLY